MPFILCLYTYILHFASLFSSNFNWKTFLSWILSFYITEDSNIFTLFLLFFPHKFQIGPDYLDNYVNVINCWLASYLST